MFSLHLWTNEPFISTAGTQPLLFRHVTSPCFYNSPEWSIQTLTLERGSCVFHVLVATEEERVRQGCIQLVAVLDTTNPPLRPFHYHALITVYNFPFWLLILQRAYLCRSKRKEKSMHIKFSWPLRVACVLTWWILMCRWNAAPTNHCCMDTELILFFVVILS